MLAQKMSHDTSTSTRTFLATDPVLIENLNNTGPKWFQGHIIQPVGSLSYLYCKNIGVGMTPK